MTVRKLRGPALLLALLLIAGCSWSPGKGSPTKGSTPPDGAGIGSPASPVTAAPNPDTAPGPVPAWTDADLEAVGSPVNLTQQELKGWVTKAAGAGKEPLADWLKALWAYYQLEKRGSFQAADLDGDGKPEVVLTLTGQRTRDAGPAGLFVIYRHDARYAVDERLATPERDTAELYGVADLTGDGRPEIVASVTGHGAHTVYSTVDVLRWTPGQFERLPGPAMTMNFMELKIDGKDLVLSGGTSGSVGAGPERTYTDRYRWVNGAMALVDRHYAPSEDSYFLLQDGIVAEQFGRKEDARAAYARAMEPGRTALSADALDPSTPEAARKFGEAVRAFARFRLGALLLSDPATAAEGRKVLGEANGIFAGLPSAMLAAGEKEAGCRVATEWAVAAPDFLTALNSPWGYGQPTWTLYDLCFNALPPHR